jgi:DNA processing protein
MLIAGVAGIGPVSFQRLLETFGSARGILRAAAAPGSAAHLVAATSAADGGTPSLAAQAAAELVAAAGDPAPRLRSMERDGLQVVTLADPSYPLRLRHVELPPPVLFVRGAVAALSSLHPIAVVGTRRPTGIGRATAARIGEALAATGAVVVSGLALGVDGAAHAAAVRAGVPTVAVMGGGHDHLYPAAHRGLAASIEASGGAVVSEFPPGMPPSRGTFPRRNRIISGLSDATVVVEAGIRSGALTTAAWALEQGRGLFIVPGRMDDPAVAGSLAFLREGGPQARIVVGVAELIEDLGLIGSASIEASAVSPAASVRSGGGLGPAGNAVRAALQAGASGVDELVAATGLRGAVVLGVLTRLEDQGLVVETFGRYHPAGQLAAKGHVRVPLPNPRVGIEAA